MIDLLTFQKLKSKAKSEFDSQTPFWDVFKNRNP